MDRRKFIKDISTGLAAFTIRGFGQNMYSNRNFVKLGRVAADSLSVHAQPSEKSTIRFQRFFNDLLNIYDEVISDDGPGYNPVWYQVWGGYVHSSFVQSVENRLNPIKRTFPTSGTLMQLTKPYSMCYRIRSNSNWEEFYTLYYDSTHWVFDIVEGPYGFLYYEIRNALLTLSYYVRAEHFRIVEEGELLPISPNVKPQEKRIEISIDFQSLRAYENDLLVKDFYISTGLPNTSIDPNVIPTDTPKGDHIIHEKRPSVHMGDGTLRSDAEAYELPGVPWVSYFDPRTGVAIHGAYWHNNFGVTMSHGCINMRPEDAKWVYRWTTPYPDGSASEFHTPVIVY